MKQALYNLILVELILIVLLLSRGLYSEQIISTYYWQLSEVTGGQLEAFARTKGAHAKNAFICKTKAGVVYE